VSGPAHARLTPPAVRRARRALLRLPRPRGAVLPGRARRPRHGRRTAGRAARRRCQDRARRQPGARLCGAAVRGGAGALCGLPGLWLPAALRRPGGGVRRARALPPTERHMRSCHPGHGVAPGSAPSVVPSASALPVWPCAVRLLGCRLPALLPVEPGAPQPVRACCMRPAWRGLDRAPLCLHACPSHSPSLCSDSGRIRSSRIPGIPAVQAWRKLKVTCNTLESASAAGGQSHGSWASAPGGQHPARRARARAVGLRIRRVLGQRLAAHGRPGAAVGGLRSRAWACPAKTERRAAGRRCLQGGRSCCRQR